MDAIVTAGGIPRPGESLYEESLGKPKSLLDICGKPMIQWVLDALESAEIVDRVVIVGLSPDSGVTCSKSIAFVPNQGGLLENMRAGVRRILEPDQTPRLILLVASDVPAITPDMVDWMVKKAILSNRDVCYSMVTRQVMEARFPGSKRPFPFEYARLRDIEVCGGQMLVIHTTVLMKTLDEIMKRLVAFQGEEGLIDRSLKKSVFKKVALILHYFGLSGLISVLLGTVGLEEAVERVSKRFGVTGHVILCPHAEVGMDADRPDQLEMLRAYLSRHEIP